MRSASTRLLVAVLASVLAGTAMLSACSTDTGQLGQVPIPSASAGPPQPVTASQGHPQLLAMGAPVEVSLPDGVSALIVASGPAVDPPPGGAKPDSAATGTITLTATPTSGTVRLTVGDLQCRDQSGNPVALAPVGPDAVSATQGHPATLTVTGTFHTGGAQINWQQNGHVLAMWDFSVEID